MGEIDTYKDLESKTHLLDGRSDNDLVRLAALGMMASGIVHDFGNLMQVVSSAIRLIEQKLDQTALVEVGPFIKGAQFSVDRATVLSRQILGVSRADRAFDEFVNLGSVLASIEHPIRWAAGSDIRVELCLEDNLLPVFCNVREFESVMLNLVINAKDAMPNGGRLSISVACGSGVRGETVILRVTDTGCGMSPEIAKRAFQPLFTTKPLGRGCGFGLATVREFALRMGGSAQIESAVGCGTSIILRLPACGN